MKPSFRCSLAGLVAGCFASVTTADAQTITIGEARQQPFNSTVTRIAGRVTVAGQFRNTAFLQDGTAGIAIFNTQFRQGARPGDSVVIEGGTLIEFQPTTGQPGTGLTQLSGESLTFTVIPVPRQEVTPRSITVPIVNGPSGEQFEGMLVRLRNVRFQQTGAFQGETNYTVLDNNDNFVTVRIDGGSEIATNSLPIPEGRVDVIGVVSQFRGGYQIQPRFATDLGLPPVTIDTVSRGRTADVSTWNLEWFGSSDTTRGPRDKNRQIRSVRQVIDSLRADVVAVQEVLTAEALQRVSDSLSGTWSYLFASDIPSDQKLGFVYNTATVTPVSSGLAVVGAGDAWAGGRFPYRLTCTIGQGASARRMVIFTVHGKATDSVTAEQDYNRRKNDYEAFHAYLRDFYADSLVVIAGDFNDISTASVVNETYASPFSAFINDAENWHVPTKELEERGLSSFVGFNRSFLDHIIVSNEVRPFVHRTFVEAPTAYLSSYTSTVSDHVPVTTRIFLQDGITSVQEDVPTLGLRIGPNPVSSHGTVEVSVLRSGPMSVDVIDAAGAVVLQISQEFAPTSATRVIPFNASQLASGLYRLRVMDATGIRSLPLHVVR
jgi:endonuclease/exonuclease/phosphatase family metal-dependent hydrolase